MSDQPITRDPDAINRISGNEYTFRVEVLTALTRIETTLSNHTQEDEKRFRELGEKYTGVSSSVGDLDKDRSKFVGIWIGVSGVVIALFTVVATWIK